MEINWKHFTDKIEIMPEVLVGTVVLYILIILYTRVFGLKSFSKMTGFDFLNTVAIGNLLAMSAATSSPSLFVGALLIGLLYLINYLVTVLMFKSDTGQNLMDNSPILLMRDGKILEENLEKTKVTKDELRGKLREANVIRLSEVRAVVLETTGDVSVLHTDGDEKLEDFIMTDVRDY
ncbi:DUF421 domain-containing protein [Nonlabens marinus]|uniref:YetF C-terminal domain-containing protein n=1 Tax=Nonlabens marinus S1-08 TaxID=1454201 RepID=W8W073_9FLAO|nr:YetF domain-containing protein [Nonlabens marinus]BAO55826.1 conserved hypothetical protein-putative membrane protein [Nonlabens marinus S1-08]